jgi:hypothetical protein
MKGAGEYTSGIAGLRGGSRYGGWRYHRPMARRLWVFAAIAVAAMAGCSLATTGRAPAGPTVAETIDAQMAKDEAMPWAQRRPLTWADFKGRPPADAGQVAAETAYSLIQGAGCTGSTFEFRVVAAFRPNQSWVRPSVLRTPADSAHALRHEQTHFDLTEVHARRLRRYFAELIAPCRISTNDLEAEAARVGREEKAAQALYDAETDHGRVAAQQTRWEKDVAGQLTSLAKFAR